jgi:hypothetical protein
MKPSQTKRILWAVLFAMLFGFALFASKAEAFGTVGRLTAALFAVFLILGFLVAGDRLR